MPLREPLSYAHPSNGSRVVHCFECHTLTEFVYRDARRTNSDYRCRACHERHQSDSGACACCDELVTGSCAMFSRDRSRAHARTADPRVPCCSACQPFMYSGRWWDHVDEAALYEPERQAAARAAQPPPPEPPVDLATALLAAERVFASFDG